MGLFNIDLPPGETGHGDEINATGILTGILPTLHSSDFATLYNWTEAELYGYLDEGLKRLSRIACVWTGRVSSILTSAGQPLYSVPARHVASLHISHAETPLRPANQLELEMRDPDYRTTPATALRPASHWYPDLLNGGQFGVSPVPASTGNALPVVYNGYPPAVSSIAPLIAAYLPLESYLGMYVIWRAYQKEHEAEMADVAAQAKAVCELFEGVLVKLYGKGI